MAIKQNPNYAHPYRNRAIIRRINNDIDGAISDYDEAIRLKLKDASVFYDRGVLRQAKGDFSNALKDLNKATKMTPNDGVTRLSQFSLLMKLERFSEAKMQEQIVRDLIQKESEYNQACFEAICGNKDKALDLLKIALKKKQATKDWARHDSDFENIRDNPRFKELVSE